jgi:hypothetical protein
MPVEEEHIVEWVDGRGIAIPASLIDKPEVARDLVAAEIQRRGMKMPDAPVYTSAEERRDKWYGEMQELMREQYDDPLAVIGQGAEASELAGEPGMGLLQKEYWHRAWANRSTTPANLFRKMESLGYNMRVVDSRGTPTVWFQKPTGSWHQIDMGPQGSAMGDFADMAGLYGPQAVGEAVLTIATKGMSLIPRALSIMTGSATLQAADLGVEELSGYGETSLKEGAYRSALVGGMGLGAEFGTSAVARLINTARGQARFPMMPAPGKQLRATGMVAKELDLPFATPANMPGFLRALLWQATHATQKGREMFGDQLVRTFESIGKYRSKLGHFEDLDTATLAAMDKRWKKWLRAAIEDPQVRTAGATSEESILGGAAYYKLRGERTERIANIVKQKADPSDVIWDISDTQALNDDLMTGLHGKGKSGMPGDYPKIDQLSPQMQDIMERLDALDPNITTFNYPLYAKGGTDKLHPVTMEIVTAGPTKRMNSFEEIQTLRTELWNMKYQIDARPADARVAGKLWDSLTEVMDNPVTKDPKLGPLARTLAEYYKETEQLFDGAAGRMFLSKTPADERIGLLIDEFADPGKGDALSSIRKVMMKTSAGRQQYAEMRKVYVQYLLDHPTSINNKLDDFRTPEIRRLVVTDEEEVLLRKYGEDMELWNAGPIARLGQEGRREGSRAMELVEAMDVRGMREFLKVTEPLATDSAEEATTKRLSREALKAGFVENLLAKSRVSVGARGSGTNPRQFLDELERLNNGPLYQVPEGALPKVTPDGKPILQVRKEGIHPVLSMLFTDGELENFAKINYVLSWWGDVGVGTDVGTSLMVAQVAPKLLGVDAPRAYLKLGKYHYVARLLLDEDLVQKTMGLKPPGGHKTKAVVRTMGNVAANLTAQTSAAAIHVVGHGAEPMVDVDEDLRELLQGTREMR